MKQFRRFEGRCVAVTGAARGIGRNIAQAFGQEGAKVAICDIDSDAAHATAAQFTDCGIQAEPVQVDLSKPGAPQTMVRALADRWGRFDALINNARSGGRAKPQNDDEVEADWDETFSVTLRAAYLATREAVKVMQSTEGGSVVNISSINAVRATPGISATYQMAKAGMLQMTRYFAAHGGPNVRVNSVLPGLIVQDEHRERYNRDDNARYRHVAEFPHPAKRVGTSDDVANACVFLCTPEASFITGQSLIVDGGLTVQESFNMLADFDRVSRA